MATYFINGRLTRDAEMKSTKDGKGFCKFAIAWNRQNKPVHYYTCTLDADRGQKVLPYLRQGKYVIVTGEPDWYEHDGKTYEVIRVDRFSFVGGEKQSEKQENPDSLPYTCDGKYFRTREELDAYKASKGHTEEPFDDSDIPF